MRLKIRPFKITKKEDFTPENNEKAMQYFDEQFRTLDSRRITQQTELDSGALLADVITKVNTIIQALNSSDLTEE